MVKQICGLVVFVSFVSLTTGCQKKTTTLPANSASDSGFWISAFSLVDDSLSDAYVNSEIFYSGKDASGNLYLNTTTRGTGWETKWKIMRSTDQGETWSVVETSAGLYDVSYAIAGDSLGNVFAVGGESTNVSSASGIIRKFDGTSWSIVKTYQTTPGNLTYFRGVAVDSSDNIFVLGTGSVTDLNSSNQLSVYRWVTFKSSDHGATWSEVDTFAPQDNSPCYGTNIFVSSSDAIYSSGYCAFGNGQSFVRKSADGGATWSLVYETWDRKIKGIAEWNGGIIIAVDADSGPLEGYIKVFHTQDDFDHLTEIYDSGEHESGYIGSLRVDPRGYIFLSASYGDDIVAGTGHSEIVGTNDGTWSTLDRQDYTLDSASQTPNDLFFNDSDQVFYVAPYTDESSNTALRIFKADLNATTPWVPDALGNGEDLASPIPSGAKIVYVTTALTSGSLGVTPAAAIATADALCNSDINKPTFASGTFKAILVNSARVACTTANCSGGVGEHTDWVLAPSQAYVTRRGTAFGTTNTEGLFTSMDVTLGSKSPYNTWTGLNNSPQDWTNDTNFNCLDWSSNSNAEWSTVWQPYGTDLSSIYPNSTWETCDLPRALVCVEQ